MEIDLNKINKVHFIGIGGIGISAIARLMIDMGKEVTGSDLSNSPITDELSKIGIKIFIGHKSENVEKNTDVVVYTIAIKKDNPEFVRSQNLNIKSSTYPQMLSVLSKNMYTIAVSGTHGKTTTTAMISKIFIDLKLDPTVIVGSILKDHNSNLIVGKSKYFIVEACEYKRSFLNLYPNILVITNVDLDHLDYYRDLEDIQSAFRELSQRVPKDGAVICNTQDLRVQPVIKKIECRIVDYGKYINENLKLTVPGEHNRQNAGAAMAVTDFLQLGLQDARESLQNFSGTWRRFDLKGKTQKGAQVYDDYAHHPKEIISALSGMCEMYPNSLKVAFFQPHLFSRTKDLFDDFAKSFDGVDEVYVLPIFASREKDDQTVNSEMLVLRLSELGKKAFFVKNFEEALEKMNSFSENTVVINIGAGDIYKLSLMAIK